MKYSVLLTNAASHDLQDIYGYISTNDSIQNADYVLDKIEQIFANLSDNPTRGHYPKELSEIGITEYREVNFKPYRLIYRVIDTSVYVLLIADGRRDMNALLQRRLFIT